MKLNADFNERVVLRPEDLTLFDQATAVFLARLYLDRPH